MLIATPYRDFDARTGSIPPKVVSEIRKNCFSSSTCHQSMDLGPKLAGDLPVKCGNDRNWWPRKVHIMNGQLLISSTTLKTADGGSEVCLQPVRLPLRHLSLQAGPLSNSLALCKGQNIVLTLQMSSEQHFDEWAKAIAIEVIRQTPIDAIKYLDILTIAKYWEQQHQTKDWNDNDNDAIDGKSPCENCINNRIENPIKEEKQSLNTMQESDVENMLKKCQNVENYVPVKEKLFLFESLCKVGRKVRSTEDVSVRNTETSEQNKRARSMHDLSNLNTHIAVREICKYFENKKTENNNCKSNNFKMSNLSSNYCISSNTNTNLLSKRLGSDVDSKSSNDVYTFRKVITT